MQQCTSVPGTAVHTDCTSEPLTVIYESKPKHIHTKLTTEIGAFILDIVMLWILNILSH